MSILTHQRGATTEETQEKEGRGRKDLLVRTVAPPLVLTFLLSSPVGGTPRTERCRRRHRRGQRR